MSEKKLQKSENQRQRPPVVVVMGHIDHGKSTLLDYIRKSKIAETEKGGITQHISAYEVKLETGGKEHKITFLDTPGHEAFRKIRQRGAKVADVAILMVAADDGVKPQTLEALKCIKEEKIPYIVAINKIDKEGANVEKIRNNLTENEIYLEGHGGNIPSASISAKTGENVSELLELVSLVAEMENLEGDGEILGEGVVIESNLDPKKGITATVIIKNGSLKKGMFVASEDSTAPLRIMENFLGEKMEEASFSSPIRIAGWSKLPKVGASFKSFEVKKEAEEYAKQLQEKINPKKSSPSDHKEDQKTTIPLIIKADTSGSLEAVIYEIKKLESEQVHFEVLITGIGTISENDVKSSLADRKILIIGFNTKIENSAVNLAEREKVTIKTFDVIYNMTEWLKTDLKNYLPKIEKEEITGIAKIIRVFSAQKEKQVIGGKVIEGNIYKGESFRIKRRENIIGTGKIKELQQKKVATDEVKEGQEFGTLVESKIDISAGDSLEFFKLVKQEVEI